ncbi:MAG: glycoside hydrolase family 2, partial [Fibrobacter sp.]|nr:glycoside hydrolase family 2 [Fibrobacter sp.]
MCISDKLHISHWGTYVTTPEVSDESALVRVETTIKNEDSITGMFSLFLDVISPEGKILNSTSIAQIINPGKEATLTQDIKINNPKLWSVETPELYTLRSRIGTDSTYSVDQTQETFGIRTIKF